MLSADDFYQWKIHPVTIAFHQAIRERIYALQVQLGYNAGEDPVQDRKVVGMIAAYLEVLSSEPEEVIDVSNSEDARP